MSLDFHPRAGVALMCDFDGYIVPEIVKVRPVVIVTPQHLNRPGLYNVVPLSTTSPDPVRNYHYKLLKDPIPNSNAEVWAKCDLVATVAKERLDRFRIGRGKYKTSAISDEELEAIRNCLKHVLGIK